MGPDWPNVPSERLRVNTPAETSSEPIFRDRYMGLILEIVLSTLYTPFETKGLLVTLKDSKIIELSRAIRCGAFLS